MKRGQDCVDGVVYCCSGVRVIGFKTGHKGSESGVGMVRVGEVGIVASSTIVSSGEFGVNLETWRREDTTDCGSRFA